jgi:hypothetical protein
MRYLIFVTLLLLQACNKNCNNGAVGYMINGDCNGGCKLEGTEWRDETSFTGIQQAWTLVFSDKTFDSYWGLPGNYYQNHDVKSGTWECNGSSITISGYSSGAGSVMTATGTIDGNTITFPGAGGGTYIKIQ